jgi:hypothetical protein
LKCCAFDTAIERMGFEVDFLHFEVAAGSECVVGVLDHFGWALKGGE